ncbi:MAG: hypothetical protein KIS92_02310 [Planctomycetota bacterium]|nr:hypothetical protein [Planctomycetota bacterium]
MKRNVWVWGLVLGLCVLAAPVMKVRAEGEGDKKEARKARKGGGGFNLMLVDTIQEKLGTGEGMVLTEDQKTKINALREDLKKKFDEKMAAGKEKIDGAKTPEERKAAYKEVMGDFKANEEYKTGLKGILSEAQFTKLFEGAKEEKKEEKKEDMKEEKKE